MILAGALATGGVPVTAMAADAAPETAGEETGDFGSSEDTDNSAAEEQPTEAPAEPTEAPTEPEQPTEAPAEEPAEEPTEAPAEQRIPVSFFSCFPSGSTWFSTIIPVDVEKNNSQPEKWGGPG